MLPALTKMMTILNTLQGALVAPKTSKKVVRDFWMCKLTTKYRFRLDHQKSKEFIKGETHHPVLNKRFPAQTIFKREIFKGVFLNLIMHIEIY